MMKASKELMGMIGKFGVIESVVSSDAITAEGSRVSCTEVRLRLREGASLDNLITLLKLSGFKVEGSSKRGLKVKLIISDT